MTAFTTGLIDLNKALGPNALEPGKITGFFGLGSSYKTQSLVDLIAATVLFGEPVAGKLTNLIFVTIDETPAEIYQLLYTRFQNEDDTFIALGSDMQEAVKDYANARGYNIQVLKMRAFDSLLELIDVLEKELKACNVDGTPSLICVDDFEQYASKDVVERPQRFILRTLRELGQSLNAHFAVAGRLGADAALLNSHALEISYFLSSLATCGNPFVESCVDYELDNVIAVDRDNQDTAVVILKSRGSIEPPNNTPCRYDNNDGEFSFTVKLTKETNE